MPIWRTARLFLSSTFRDMHAERDHLVNAVFPRLRERLLPHRVELIDVDLRWGITAEQAENEQVLGLCLTQIDECRPFFLGFLGHRYGWVPSRVPEQTARDFAWLARHPGRSVTELEIRHGALDRPDEARALFCLRDDAALHSIPEPSRSAFFAEDDPGRARQLEELLALLRAGPHPVADYTCRWDGLAYDRPSRSHGRLVGLDAFGDAVELWLWDALRSELHLEDLPAPADPLDEEAEFHDRFMESRLRVFVGREQDVRQLHDFAHGDDDRPCLVTGPSGSGKSALLARFVRSFAAQPGAEVLAHFVGASPRTTSLAGTLGRLAAEVKRRFGLHTPIPDDPAGACAAFLAVLASVPEDRRLVLVLDALNQLDDAGGAETLHWLPERLPAHVKVIASCVTGPGRPPRVLSAFGERPFVALPMRPLSAEDRRTVLGAVPRLSAKTLDEAQKGRLLANPETENPLYLLTALEELRVYGSFETLNARIDGLPRGGDAVAALFEQVFARLEDEFDCDLVERVLSLLACARRGLSDVELKALTSDCLHGGEVFAVLRQLRPYLMSRGGRWDFFHTSIHRAVVRHYLKRDPDAEVLHLSAKERLARQRLVRHFGESRLSARSVEELPWQMAELRDWQSLWTLLADLAFLHAATRVNQFEVREYWSRVEQGSPFRMAAAYKAAVEEPGKHDVSQVWNLAHLLQTTGHLTDATRLRRHLIEYYRGGNESDYASCLGNQALILYDHGDLEGAMCLLKEQEAICRRVNNPDGLQACLGNQALILYDQGDLDGAMRLHKEEEAICRRLNNPDGLLRSLGNQALILQAQGDLEGAMRLFKEVEAICRRLNNPDGLAISLTNQAVLLAFKLHRPADALPLAQQAHELADQHGLIALRQQIAPKLAGIRALAGDGN